MLKRLDSVRETVGAPGSIDDGQQIKKDRHSLDKIECTKADKGTETPRDRRQRQAKYEVETFIDDQA